LSQHPQHPQQPEDHDPPDPKRTIVTLKNGQEVEFQHVAEVNLFAPIGVGLRNGDGILIAFFPLDEVRSVVTPERDCLPKPEILRPTALVPFPIVTKH